MHFGQGHHLCLGKSLARQECRVAFEELESVTLVRDFLQAPERYLRMIWEDGE